MLKFAHFQTIEARTAQTGHGLMKDAHRHAFQYDPRPGFLYVRSRAISSRCNDNFDEFPAAEIKQAYRTFVGKPVFVNHVNADHKRARGVIVDAALHEDVNPDGSPDVWCEVLMEVDAINFPMLAKAILAGEADRTSMGCDVGYSICSFCGNKAQTPLDYCAHIKYHKGKRIRRRNAALGVHEDVLVREICHKLSFFENSILVEEPADPTAYFLGVESGDDLVASARRTAAIDVEARTSVPKGEIATMIDSLAGKLKESKFGNISDLCEVAVEGTNLFCSASKGIPRSKMPQLTDPSGKDITDDWKKSLRDEGISVNDETVSAASLKASQNQLNGKKVAAIYDKIKNGSLDNDRIFVSSDSYIVDGHHRWAAKVAYDLIDGDLGDVMMPITRVDLPILKLLDKANAFAKEHGIAQRGVNAHLRAYAVGPLDTPVGRVAIYKGLGVDLPVKLHETAPVQAAASLSDLASSLVTHALQTTAEFDVGDKIVLRFKEEGLALGVLKEWGDEVVSFEDGRTFKRSDIYLAAQTGPGRKRMQQAAMARTASVKTAGHILKLKQIRKGDEIRFMPSSEVHTITNVETGIVYRAGGGPDGVRITVTPPMPGGRDTMTMGADETLYVVNPGSRKAPEWEPPPPPAAGTSVQAYCPVCQRDDLSMPYGGKLPRHNNAKSRQGISGTLCEGSGKTPDEAKQIGEEQRRTWEREQRYRTYSRTASYGTLWRSSTGGLHKSLLCPNINAQSNITPVPVEDVTEAAVVASKAKDACSLCFPTAPPRRTPAMATASLMRFVASYADLTEEQLLQSYLDWIEDSRTDPFGISQIHIDTITGIEAEYERRGLPKPAWPARAAASLDGTFAKLVATALGEQKAPPEVDTLRDEACPVCGETEAYTGDDCGVCGFKKPPDAFMDPDVDKAKSVDLRQDNEEAADDAQAVEDPSLQCSNCGKTFGGGPAAPGAPAPKAPAAGGSGVERFKVAYLPEPEKDGTPTGDKHPETSPQAGDPCPDCGEGTLNPVEAPASAPQEVEPSATEPPSGESEEEVTNAPDDPAEDDESETKPEGEDDDDPDAPKEQSRRKKET